MDVANAACTTGQRERGSGPHGMRITAEKGRGGATVHPSTRSDGDLLAAQGLSQRWWATMPRPGAWIWRPGCGSPQRKLPRCCAEPNFFGVIEDIPAMLRWRTQGRVADCLIAKRFRWRVRAPVEAEL